MTFKKGANRLNVQLRQSMDYFQAAARVDETGGDIQFDEYEEV